MLIRVILLLGRLPLRLRRLIGRAGGALFSLIPTRDRNIAALQLAMVFGKNAPPIHRVYAHIGQVALEAINLKPLLKQVGTAIDTSQSDREWARLGGTRPIVALSAHTGNWEVLAAAIIARGVPLTLIAREAQRPEWQTLLAGIRSDYGGEVVWRSDRAGTTQILRALSEKKVVAALLDQDTEVRSIFLPFFSAPVRIPSALIDLGRRYGAAFVTAFSVRLPNGVYELRVKQFDDSLSAEELLGEYHRRLEAVIREYPEQWVWFHKRWRSLPDGTRLSSREYLAHLKRAVGGDIAG